MKTSWVLCVLSIYVDLSLHLLPVLPCKATTQVRLEDIAKLHERMLEEFHAHPDEYDETDIERIKRSGTGETDEDDWPVRRYLIWQGTIDKSMDLVKKTFKWRRESRINHLTARDFPCEFIQAAPLFLTEDRQRRPAMYFNMATHGPFGSLRSEWYSFLYWNAELVDQLAGNRQWFIFGDFGKLGVSNLDLQGVHFFFPVADRFPCGSYMGLIYNVGPILSPVVNMVLTQLFPARLSALLHVASESREAYKYVRRRDFPVYTMGGKKRRQWAMPLIRNATQLCRPLSEFAREKNWPKEDVQYFLDFNKEEISANGRDKSKNYIYTPYV